MAIPKTLKPISEAKARALIEKHLKANTGWWEEPNERGDFVYKTNNRYVLLRESFFGDWETGTVVM